MRKRIMAMLLALVMVVGVLPVAALAEEPVSTTEPTTVPTETTAPTEAVRAPVANSTGDKGIALQSQQNGNGISPRASSYVTLYLRFFSPDAPFYATGTGDHTEESVTVSQEIRRSTIGKDEASGTVTAYFKPYKTNGWMLYYKVTIGNHEYSEMSNYACCIFNKDMSKATGSATFNISFNSAEDPQTTVHISGAQDLPSTTYTVTYTDGVNGAAFPDQSYSGLASGATTPEFNGTPTREGFVWVGWNPAVTSTVTKNATYTAVWEEAVPSKPEWSDIRGEMQKVSVHVTCINPDVNHTDKTYPYQESTDDVIGYVQDSAGSYTCTVTVHLGRYRTNYNSDFNREHQFASSLTADVVLQYNGTGWVIASALPLELKLTCGSAPTPDPPGQDVLGRLLVQVECDAITYHFTKTYQLDDGDYRLEKVDDNTYTVTVTADKYVEKYNIDYGVHTLFDNNTKTIKLVYRYGAWTVVGSNGVTFNVSCEQKYTVTYTDGVDGEVIFNDQVYYKKPGEKTPAFRGTPTRTGYKFIGWEPAVAATVTGNATYTAVWEEEKYTVTYTDGVENEEIFADQVYGNLLSGTATPAFNGTPTRPGYVFTGWNPAVAATVTGNATYTAVWEVAQPEKPALPEKDDIAVGGDGFYFKCISGIGHASSDQWKTRLSKYLDAYNIVGTEAAKGADGRYFFNVEVTVAPYLPDYTAWVNRDHTICDGEPAKVTLTFYYNETTQTWAQDEAAIPYVRTECKEDEIPDPASGAFDNWNIQLDCVTDDSHDHQLRYSDGTYRFERHDDPQYGRLVFDAASYLAKYNEIFKDDHGNHGLNDATAAVTLELAYKDGQWQPKVPNALPTIQVTCANEPEAPEKPTHEDLKNIIASVKLQCVTAPDPAHADQLYSLNENAYDVTNPTLEDGQYTCVVTVKSDYYLNNLNQYDLGPHTISGDTRKNIKLIWDSQNKNWAAEDGKKQKIVFNIQCETLTVTYTDGVDGVEVFADVVHEKLPYGAKTPAFYTKDPFRKGYVFTGWNPAVAATVTGNATYAAVWEEDANGNGTPDKDEEKYTVTYTDGVENEEIFADQVYSNLLPDTATPAFNGTPTRTGYVFGGWNPAVAAKVTENKIYSATWKPDANGNGIADDEEDKFTVTYTDGADGKVFADKVHNNLLSGTDTPAFNGTPTRTGYVFGGWNPAVAAKVTESKIYSATWKADVNGNGIADDEEDKYTVTYTDGVKGKAFADQVYDNLLSGTDTPAFNGKPTRKGYTFVSWTPKVTDTVTKTVTYTATWKANSGKDNVPKTGDSGIVPVLGSVLLFSFCGAAACVFDRKRKHI